MKLRDYLLENDALTTEICKVDYHMNLLNFDLDELKRRIPILSGKDDEELLNIITMIYRKCDSSSPEFDGELDEDMVRIGLRTDRFYGGRPKNKWDHAGLFADDGFGFGTEPTSLYDDYIDSQVDSGKKY